MSSAVCLALWERVIRPREHGWWTDLGARKGAATFGAPFLMCDGTMLTVVGLSNKVTVMLAEIGVWNNMLDLDLEQRAASFQSTGGAESTNWW